jgi:hypothetical protein
VSALDRLPPLATTGVGSLPFDDPALAVRHACRAYDLPFVPQLPALDGDMVGEWLGAVDGATPCGWSAERDRERPAAWDAFVARVTRCPPVHGLVKLQVTGPVTLAVALERAAGRPGQGRAATALARELDGWLASNVAGQVARLAALGLDALVVVDEPGLAHAVAGLGREETGADPGVWGALRSSGAAWGLHVCCAVPWTVVRAAEPDWVSFDATASPVGGRGARVLGELVRGGARIAWGALDPVAPDGATGVAARVAAGIGAITATGVSVDTLFAGSAVTPACGTGQLPVDRERLVASVLEVGAETVAATCRAWPREAGAGETVAAEDGIARDVPPSAA